MLDNIWDSGIRTALLNAATELMASIGEHRTIKQKSKHDYVTDLDLKLETRLREVILSHFPAHYVFGEESIPDVVDFDQPTWLLDPLDGTSNFIFGIPFYGASIAFVANNKVEMGIVFDFVHGEAFEAGRGKGAFLNNRRLSKPEMHSDYIGLSSGFIARAATHRPSLLAELKTKGKFRLLGSQALHLCYVAAGRYKACVNDEAKPWDDLAGALIIEEAGGIYTNQANFQTANIGSVNMKRCLYSCATFAMDTDIRDIYTQLDIIK